MHTPEDSSIVGRSALPRSSDYWTRIINDTPTIVCGIAPDGTTTFINPSGRRILGGGRNIVRIEVKGCHGILLRKGFGVLPSRGIM
jgi:hypothetical protein